MKRFSLIIITFLMTLNWSFGQYILKDKADVEWYNNIAQEKVYLHLNSDVFLTGEQLMYKLFCFNAKSNRLSKNSKIAYVELIGKNGSVLTHKLRLNDGVGSSDFIIPDQLETGHYKLVGYTQWMKNSASRHFIQSDLTIINPNRKIEFYDSSETNELDDSAANGNKNIFIETNRELFQAREEVVLTFKGLKPEVFGKYHVSVRKDDAIINKISSPEYSDKAVSEARPVGASIYLPEFQGEMITGEVIHKDSAKPAVNVDVGLSILGDDAHQDIVVTNQQGVYYFNLKSPVSSPIALIQVMGENRMNYQLKVNKHKPIDHKLLEFENISIPSHFEEGILKRKINNQIENAFRTVKQDRSIAPNYQQPFYGIPQTTYFLDDYKRFETVAETLTEVVDHAWHERKNGPTRYINVRERENDPYYGEDILPLVVVDGAMVQDHESILYYDANKVKSMGVIRDEFYYGKRVYQGALIINTFNKDFYNNLTNDSSLLVDLITPQKTSIYFNQDYSSEVDYSRIPDYRRQLFWAADIELNNIQKEYKFFTSDLKGAFKITFEGYTNSGKHVSITKIIEVR